MSFFHFFKIAFCFLIYFCDISHIYKVLKHILGKLQSNVGSLKNYHRSITFPEQHAHG